MLCLSLQFWFRRVQRENGGTGEEITVQGVTERGNGIICHLDSPSRCKMKSKIHDTHRLAGKGSA